MTIGNINWMKSSHIEQKSVSIPITSFAAIWKFVVINFWYIGQSVCQKKSDLTKKMSCLKNGYHKYNTQFDASVSIFNPRYKY